MRLEVTGLRVRLDDPVAGDEELVAVQCPCDLVEPVARHGDLEILVLAVLPSDEEIDRPSGRDTPRRLDVREDPRDLFRPPGVPLVQIRLIRDLCSFHRRAM